MVIDTHDDTPIKEFYMPQVRALKVRNSASSLDKKWAKKDKANEKRRERREKNRQRVSTGTSSGGVIKS